jgi:hypothetical protein
MQDAMLQHTIHLLRGYALVCSTSHYPQPRRQLWVGAKQHFLAAMRPCPLQPRARGSPATARLATLCCSSCWPLTSDPTLNSVRACSVCGGRATWGYAGKSLKMFLGAQGLLVLVALIDGQLRSRPKTSLDSRAQDREKRVENHTFGPTQQRRNQLQSLKLLRI